MNLYLSEFVRGVQETLELHKQADANIFDMGNGTMFPNLSSQAKWKFARIPGGLRLSDGQHVYQFKTPAESEDSDFPAEQDEAPPVVKFDEGALQKGTAQVHRASPSSIYFTLQEGTKNPTYTYQHTGGKSWKVTPKKKLKKLIEKLEQAGAPQQIQNVEPQQFESGMVDQILKSSGFLGGLDQAGGSAINKSVETIFGLPAKIREAGPLGMGALGLGAGAAYDMGRRALYNTDEENEQETTKQRLMRYILPALGGGVAGGLTRAVTQPTGESTGAVTTPNKTPAVTFQPQPDLPQPGQTPTDAANPQDLSHEQLQAEGLM